MARSSKGSKESPTGRIERNSRLLARPAAGSLAGEAASHERSGLSGDPQADPDAPRAGPPRLPAGHPARRTMARSVPAQRRWPRPLLLGSRPPQSLSLLPLRAFGQAARPVGSHQRPHAASVHPRPLPSTWHPADHTCGSATTKPPLIPPPITQPPAQPNRESASLSNCDRHGDGLALFLGLSGCWAPWGSLGSCMWPPE